MFNVGTNPQRSTGFRARIRRRASRAFTLAEVMMATAVFTMGILGVYAMMIKSYELVTLARHRDNARALLISFSDQFLRLGTTEKNPDPDLPPNDRGLFTITAPGGEGLTWTDSKGIPYNGTGITSDTSNAYLGVWLGQDESSRVWAKVSREVRFVRSDGVATTTNTPTAAGWLLQGKFTIEYDIAGRTQQQSITVARSKK